MENDHRSIGKKLDLYHIQEHIPGMVFWHNNGLIIFQEIKKFIRKNLVKYNYQEVKSPIIMNKELWIKTGHWDNFHKKMFEVSSKNSSFCIKPMNCPGHMQIFNNKLRSYRDLPMRIAEFGICHRKELSGSLYGLMRLVNFTQDDAHIFCTENQINEEINNCIKMTYDIYRVFGFNNILVRLSTRPEKRIGEDIFWDKAEKILIESLERNNIFFEYQNGDGAFYGPKIEFILLDYLGRLWQCGTIQLDLVLSKKLNLYYVNKNNQKSLPVIIHRAILGSLERFIGIITEEYIGSYPTWLAPIQIVIISITENQIDYVIKLTNKLLSFNLRIKNDLRNEKLEFKIREHTLNNVPYILICGNKEMLTDTVTVRTRKGSCFFNISIDKFLFKIKKEIKNYSFNQMEE